MLQSWAWLGLCGLCGVLRACAMAKPWLQGLILVCARGIEPASSSTEECGVIVCFCWCCMPLWAYSTPTSTVAHAQWPGHGQGVLPRPRARAIAAGLSRSGLASERVLGAIGRLGTPLFWRESFFAGVLV